MDIQTQKSLLIEQFKQIDDIDLIKAIKQFLNYAVKKQTVDIDVPEWHKKIVRTRIKNTKPEECAPWGDVEKKLDMKYK